MKKHQYKSQVVWEGNTGEGTKNYTSYGRDYTISHAHKPPILGSSDPHFRGNPERINPEELLLSSVSSCHMLWYLHLCSANGVIVLSYSDDATGVMVENADGSGYFSEITLHPKVLVKDLKMIAKALELHHEANKLCFIANSLNFKVLHVPTVEVLNDGM
ncbi:OsmC family protein [Leadbetterella byssophila DSM 17132]|uniref:OsmC family protein n=1 Tax=Leadbetterella byssophila (strain DSM 17132 / JCM 16389 / KACC 11308 / NBRC 106382 / 4M15) TaxID=649349 RepID=E4RZE1_LEAB4|nr:OsmC family protein [Leadbetterella byssophila]ADQ16480.1 OsmC family protein [Leadbetterella byssophila DSM 17132]